MGAQSGKSMSQIDPSARIGENTKIWDFSQVRENVVIGKNCVIGRNVYIGPGVIIGDNCKIQNNALIYEPAIIEDGAFIGPAVVLTNDKNPRAVNNDGSLKKTTDWEMVGVTVRKGASVGANSTCIAPVEIGEWSLVGAGSVVTRDVNPFTTVAGNPARPLSRSLHGD
jgi:acetyltransferase-like isoleucine patch superfamily enzyme